MKLSDYEIREDREVYGGGDGRAINRHSVRCYQVPGRTPRFYLSRTLDGCLPFCELYTFHEVAPSAALSHAWHVDGARYFGDGLSWRKAEELAARAIEEAFRTEQTASR